MKEYSRTTRECSLDSLQPDLAAAIRDHIELYKMGNIESSVLICCETISTQKKSGLFSSGLETIITGALLTPAWLILATKKGNEKPGVISGRLQNIQVQDFKETAMFKINPDTGLNVTGRYSDVTKQGMTFLGLGMEPAAQKFRQILQDAMQKVVKVSKWSDNRPA